MNLKQKWLAGCAVALLGLGSNSQAATIIGGNASDFASATNILDIVFAIDTSGSMNDDIIAIGNVASAAITGLSCPDDVWVRARFFGIEEDSNGPVFDEDLRVFLSGQPGAVVTIDDNEDNGPAVSNTADYYPWFQGDDFDTNDTTGKNLYKAVVHIGDEGTQDGSPIVQNDWDAALDANQRAIANDVFLFSWVTDDPRNSFVAPVWQSMAEGGGPPAGSGFTGGNCGDTGGSFIDGRLGQSEAEVQATIQQIICTAGGGGTGEGEAPVPATLALLGIGLLGLGFRRRVNS